VQFSLYAPKERTIKKRFLSLQWKMALPVGALLLAVSLPAQAASDFNLSTGSGSCTVTGDCSWDGRHSLDR
jgi:hypothetical protein